MDLKEGKHGVFNHRLEYARAECLDPTLIGLLGKPIHVASRSTREHALV